MATYSVKEMREYLLREHGFDEDVVKGMTVEELYDVYESYHEY